MGRSAEALLK